MKKIIIILLALFTVFSLTTCKTLETVLQEPVVSLHSVELANMNINNVQLLCKVQIQNPNSFSIPFPETGWEVFLNAASFVSGVIKNDRSLSSKRTTIVEIPVTLNYLDIFNTFRSIRGTRQTAYKIALAVKMPIPLLGDKIWNLQHEGSLPVLQLPRISAPTMNIDVRDTSKVEIIATINVENPNVFPIPAPKFSYDYQLNRNSFIKGTIENEPPLAASSTTPISFRLVVNYADLIRSFAASLLTGSSLSSNLRISGDFGIPAFSGDTFNYEVSGSLPLR